MEIISLSQADIGTLRTALGWVVAGCIVSFAWSPILTSLLYRFRIVRRAEHDPTAKIGDRSSKFGTPVMGGLLVIITVAALTILFNWERSFTWVPIGVMLIAAFLGALDDLLNANGGKRRNRTLKLTLRLIRVHKDKKTRLYLLATLPWTAFKRLFSAFGSSQIRGVHVHEKLILQFLAGGIAAWWIYFKLGDSWREIYVPFASMIEWVPQFIDISWLIIPLIILIVMFTANAVNIADGMDGLAGGMLIPTFAGLTLLSWALGFQEMAILNAVTVGSLIAYTYFNIKPARFQMGDVGSLGLGALLAINALVINQMIALIFLGFMFYIEAMSSLIQIISRHLASTKIFKMAPLHHHFEMIGWSEEKTIMRFWVVHLAFVMIGVWVGLY